MDESLSNHVYSVLVALVLLAVPVGAVYLAGRQVRLSREKSCQRRLKLSALVALIGAVLLIVMGIVFELVDRIASFGMSGFHDSYIQYRIVPIVITGVSSFFCFLLIAWVSYWIAYGVVYRVEIKGKGKSATKD